MSTLPAPGGRLGPYEIVELLGRGGMGAVFRAVDGRTGALVALKVIAADGEPGAVERFRREATAARAVVHPNTVRVLDSSDGPGSSFIAFELVDGGSLADRVKKSGPLPWREAIRMGAAIARGLAAIHAAGIVHRDLKPANVLLDRGVPRITDFGLAATRAHGPERLTRTGEVLGTLDYVSPEQADGARAIDGRADLYSLGALLHELLTGRPPFEGRGLELIVKHLRQPPPRPGETTPGIPRAVDTLVVRLLSKAPAERGASAEDVARELEALDREPRRYFTVFVAALLVVVSVGVAVALSQPGGREPLPVPFPATKLPALSVPTSDEPAWFRALAPDRRPTLPAGLLPSRVEGEYLGRDGSALVHVPAGRNEGHRALLSAFFIGKRPVKLGQFRRWVDGHGRGTVTERTGGTRIGSLTTEADLTWRKPDGEVNPPDDACVAQLYWKDALDYAEAHDLTLPTEAQWHRARQLELIEGGRAPTDSTSLLREWCLDEFEESPRWWDLLQQDPLVRREVAHSSHLGVRFALEKNRWADRDGFVASVSDLGFRVAVRADHRSRGPR